MVVHGHPTRVLTMLHLVHGSNTNPHNTTPHSILVYTASLVVHDMHDSQSIHTQAFYIGSFDCL